MNRFRLQFHVDPSVVEAIYERGKPTKAGNARKAAGQDRSMFLIENSAKYWMYDYDYLDMPTRLTVDNQDLWHCGGRPHLPIDKHGIHWQAARLPSDHVPQCPWYWMPVLGLAINGYLLIQSLPSIRVGRINADFRGVLEFRIAGSHIEFAWAPGRFSHQRSSFEEHRSRAFPRAPYGEVLEAWSAFAEDVRRRLPLHVPELLDVAELQR